VVQFLDRFDSGLAEQLVRGAVEDADDRADDLQVGEGGGGKGLGEPFGDREGQVFGASSPRTICRTVATTRARTTENAETALADRPVPSNAGLISAETEGSARKPTTRPVTVVPS
jgi:hypothetical protein